MLSVNPGKHMDMPVPPEVYNPGKLVIHGPQQVKLNPGQVVLHVSVTLTPLLPHIGVVSVNLVWVV